jgi:phage terminase small subunit
MGEKVTSIKPKQQRFIREYLIDLNATQAAIRAGYSANSAEVQGFRLLTNVKIQAEIAILSKKILDKIEITAEKVLNELALCGFANMQDYIKTSESGDAFVDLSALTRSQAAAIQEITVEDYMEGRGASAREVKRTKFKLAEKRGSLELLGRYMKLFTDKVEHSGSINHDHFDASSLSSDELAKLEALVETAHAGSDKE